MKFWTMFAAAIAVTMIVAQPASAQRPNREEMKKKIMEKFDKDGDGKLNDKEKAALKEAIAKRRAEAAKKGEGPKKDGPKKGDEAKKDGPRKGERGDRDAWRERLLKKFDKDGDGKLNDEEKAAAKKAMEERREQMKKEGKAPRGDKRGPRGEKKADA